MKALLELKCDPARPDEDTGGTPLHWAAFEGLFLVWLFYLGLQGNVFRDRKMEMSLRRVCGPEKKGLEPF